MEAFAWMTSTNFHAPAQQGSLDNSVTKVSVQNWLKIDEQQHNFYHIMNLPHSRHLTSAVILLFVQLNEIFQKSHTK